MIGTQTYIIKTIADEYYCGKTDDIKRRMKEHVKDERGWFRYKKRKIFLVIWVCEGDYEKEIKRFGVQKFIEMLRKKNIETGLEVSLS